MGHVLSFESVAETAHGLGGLQPTGDDIEFYYLQVIQQRRLELLLLKENPTSPYPFEYFPTPASCLA